MDEAAQGIATAALTLQSILPRALVHRGVPSREEALGVVDRSPEAASNVPSAQEAGAMGAQQRPPMPAPSTPQSY
jgi:hypothetical protein